MWFYLFFCYFLMCHFKVFFLVYDFKVLFRVTCNIFFLVCHFKKILFILFILLSFLSMIGACCIPFIRIVYRKVCILFLSLFDCCMLYDACDMQHFFFYFYNIILFFFFNFLFFCIIICYHV